MTSLSSFRTANFGTVPENITELIDVSGLVASVQSTHEAL